MPLGEPMPTDPPAIAALVDRLREEADLQYSKDAYDLCHEAAAALEALALEREKSILMEEAKRIYRVAERERDAARERLAGLEASYTCVVEAIPQYEAEIARLRASLAEQEKQARDMEAERDELRARVAELGIYGWAEALHTRIASLESESRQLSLDLQAAEARASVAEAKLLGVAP